jgi:hypothetical protein
MRTPEEPELAPSRAAGVARDKEMRETAPMGEVGSILEGSREAGTEVPVRDLKATWNETGAR